MKFDVETRPAGTQRSGTLHPLRSERDRRSDRPHLCKARRPGRPVRRLHRAAETEKKILRDVFEPGDAWFRTGDLMRRDDAGFYFFIDRIGDTFRWKGENISTSEVAAAITAFPGVLDASVYGVAIPGTDGRAGMAEIVCAGDLDIAALHEHLVGRLSRHAVPVLLRIRSEIDLTPTFKQKKNAQEESVWDPSICPDALYVHNSERGAFVPLDLAIYERIRTGQVRF